MPGDLSVRRRVLLAAVFSLLLPVPLGFLLSRLLHGGFSSAETEKRFSPMLSLEERRKLLTFDHTCRGSQDCEQPLGCLQDFRRFKLSVCVGSECEVDTQCPEGQVCQALKTQDDGPLVRLCVATGTRKEGEGCAHLPKKQEVACEPGLLCNKGYCGRQCQLGDPQGCPKGFVCGQGADGASCLPACEEGQCPEGQECVHFEGRFASCAQVLGKNCDRTPCPPGQECRIGSAPGVGDRVTMECLLPCDDPKNPCPPGSICSFGYCGRPCDPKAEGGCGPDEACSVQVDPNTREKLWLCRARRG
jgi:hypothetical protein